MYICINFLQCLLYNVHIPTTCMKKYPNNVIRISGCFIAKQTASKMEGLQLSELLQILCSLNKNILLKQKLLQTQFLNRCGCELMENRKTEPELFNLLPFIYYINFTCHIYTVGQVLF